MILPIGKQHGISYQIPGSGGIILMEVLLATLLLGVGLVALYQPLLSAISVLGYMDDRMEANYLVSGEIWSLQDRVRKTGRLRESGRDVALGANRVYEYSFSTRPVGNSISLFETEIIISWVNGGRTKNLTRTFYLDRPHVV